MRKILLLLVVLVCACVAYGQDVTEGSLYASSKGKELGACPLRTTAVRADIGGFLARVTVKQEFENSFTSPIEAVYVFPLSQKGAVDQMTMTVGTRVIRGKIMRREEARQTYETAKSEGKTAALLDQERANIFTQSVANIMPGEAVTVEISYVETLKYEDGAYEFVFPMTVGPRYIPGGVTDAAKIRPPVAETRAGHDISIEVNLNAGVPVEEIRSTSHDIAQTNLSPTNAKVALRQEKVIPNKDFILRYDVTGKRIEDAVLAHRDARGGFFTLILQPPDKIATEDRTPKEIVFVLDTSGSMSGFPIEKAKEAMKLSLDGLYPEDTFNLITFAGDTHILFDGPVPATQANIELAQAFLETRQGGGGTEMMKAIKAALDPSDSNEHLRIACFMTDAFVGNDDEIVAEIQKHPKARVFAFGIGSSVNRSLLDRMIEAGRGEVDYVGLDDDGSKAAKKFYERVRTPLLTDLSIEWNGMPVADVYPSRLTDLFSAKPVIVHGRYTKAAAGTIKLRGLVAGQPYEREIKLDLPESQPANDVLATLWARTQIDDLTADKLKESNARKAVAIDKQIENLGLEFRLMTSFTSFVAVEDRIVNRNGKPVTIQVPVELPDGSAREQFVENFWKRRDPNAGGGGGGGGASQTVNVTGSPVQSTNATVGSTISSRQIQQLPAAQRSNANLAIMSPGTTAASKSKARRSGSGSGSGSGQGSGSGSVVGYGSGNGSGSGDGNGGPPPKISGVTQALQIISKPRPAFTDQARQNNLQGTVILRVTFLASGQIGAISTVKGLPYGLTEQAIAAARRISFTPKKIDGVAQSVTRQIEYSFSTEASEPTLGDDDEPAVSIAPTPEMLRDARFKEKLHTWLYALVGRLAKNEARSAANESLFVRDGKADIRITLSKRTDGLIEKLKAAGFEIVTDKGKTEIAGRIAIDKLAALAEIEEVKLILPKI